MAVNQIPIQTINSTRIVPVLNQSPQATTTGLITGSGQVVTALDLRGVGSVSVTVYGTYAGINLTFEVFDNLAAQWIPFPVQPVTTAGGLITATGTITANSSLMYDATPLLGVDQFRVRATTYTSGTMNVVLHPSVQFVEPSVTVNGTVTASPTGTYGTREVVASTGTITQVTPATTVTTIKAANTARRALVLVNGGTSDVYIAYSGTVGPTAYTFLIPSLGTATIRGEEYSGLVTGLWAATGGNSMQVTETT